MHSRNRARRWCGDKICGNQM
ncbi:MULTISPECIES: CGNR zinc finger domain-containing protein [Brevibacillus]|uniref:CGNR zinc finger domain-containing protein n=1 Tax=Brevibacillus thermoruber TaxID=33942 RepID=A0A9X3TST6_9BACL|nr:MULTISPECIES: CGNR zinc finger domain-containing protein [Brevibacillus]MDA5110392.1 CGNR zinc finger domain-containing protein [Brevibacillus thermoruber]TRY27680.1 hypothetical protein FOI68_04690 [Brevibacillus sp. LEMMJ03]